MKSLSNLLKTAVRFLRQIVLRPTPKIKNAEQYEARMDVEGLVERAVAGIMITEITPQAEKDEVDDLIDNLL